MLKLLWTYVISDLNVEKIVGIFYEKELLNTVKVELDLSYFITKADLENATGVDTFDLTNLKSDVDKLNTAKLKNIPSHLINLKNKVDKLDIGKLETTPVDLSKLSNLVKNDVVKKTEYIQFVKTVNKIITTDANDLVTKTDCNATINETEKKITTDHDKYITTQKFNKLTSENFAERLGQANLADNIDVPDITYFVKKTDLGDKLKKLNKKVTSNKKIYIS